MELTVLSSSSRGNCYILQNDNEALVIEAGVSLLEVKKAVDFNISKIVGVIVSHEHGDHSKYVKEFLAARIKVWASKGTWDKCSQNIERGGWLPWLLESGVKQKIGGFTILPFDVKHDAAEPQGFLIKHEEIGTMLFVTDSYYVPYNFEGLTNILIECNYRMDLLTANIAAGRIPAALRDRTLQSHMSYDTCLEALQANDLSKVNNIVLIHLSDGNSNADEFREGIHRATGKQVHVADKGMKIQFNKTPF
jgi:phosphoribosyl 1,2-cyclic phosphodiesterase